MIGPLSRIFSASLRSQLRAGRPRSLNQGHRSAGSLLDRAGYQTFNARYGYCLKASSVEKPQYLRLNYRHVGCKNTEQKGEGNMRKTVGGALLAFAFVFGIIATTSTTADAQWRNRSYGGYNNQQIQA